MTVRKTFGLSELVIVRRGPVTEQTTIPANMASDICNVRKVRPIPVVDRHSLLRISRFYWRLHKSWFHNSREGQTSVKLYYVQVNYGSPKYFFTIDPQS